MKRHYIVKAEGESYLSYEGDGLAHRSDSKSEAKVFFSIAEAKRFAKAMGGLRTDQIEVIEVEEGEIERLIVTECCESNGISAEAFGYITTTQLVKFFLEVVVEGGKAILGKAKANTLAEYAERHRLDDMMKASEGL